MRPRAPITQGGTNLFFQLVNARDEKGVQSVSQGRRWRRTGYRGACTKYEKNIPFREIDVYPSVYWGTVMRQRFALKRHVHTATKSVKPETRAASTHGEAR